MREASQIQNRLVFRRRSSRYPEAASMEENVASMWNIREVEGSKLLP